MTDRKPPEVGTPAGMRVLNQRAVLDRLRRLGAATRPQIAKDTGLSKPTVGQALVDLERHGLVRPIGRTTAGPGRSAVVYEPNPLAGYVLGVDIGRERIRAAVADLGGSVVARVDERNRSRSASSLVRTVTELASRTVADAGIALSDVVVKVIGSPGVIDQRSRVVRHAPNLPGWESAGVLDGLESSLGPAVVVENDANLAALGEHVYGAARDVRVFVCVTVGTGVGMGICVDGVLFRGAHGAAGEVGFLPFGKSASDVQRGQFEEAAAAESVVAHARELGLAARTALEVFSLARSGDVQALEVVRVEAERLAFLVAAVAAVIDPSLVVLGGGVGSNVDLLLPPMEASLRTMTPLAPRVVAGSLGDGAVLSGAIAMGLEAARELVFEVTL
ncbi:ROK family transcriptional regulator [Lentzea aerocolonigenes]|uniref:ROK family transcriptional regulator n=1 Tax=Lentzea aerocolonigenes TaxID=68170 RepID=A0A0F0GHR4_LENAE|nr:ROK family protein [Lentzea aerocolonigenes]KJK36646.1 ROK family transcriptional regulator [Lentzea aerocolonigenes]